MSQTPLVLLGCGQMGSAIVRGLVREGAQDAPIHLVDHDQERAQALAQEIGASVGWPDAGAKHVLVAVKPRDVQAALRDAPLGAQDLVISVAAGLAVETLRAWAPEVAGVVRTMPNTPSLVGQGVTGVFGEPGVSLEPVDRLFEAVGRVVHLKEERLFDALTAISGSGPAYVFVAIEAMADGGVLMGLDRETAITLAIETFAGAAALARGSDVHTARLKDRVASPAGTTIEALRTLERHGFRDALISAVEAAATKSKKMG